MKLRAIPAVQRGNVIPRTDREIEPTNSIVATIKLPNPPVILVEASLVKLARVPINPAVPPPAIAANVHCKIGS